MMTGQDILQRALLLLHYDGDIGATGGYRRQALEAQGLAAVNQIYSDLWQMERRGSFEELSELNEPVILSLKAVHDIMPYGVAMLLAQMEGDETQQSLFASLYTQKRLSGSRLCRRHDVLPKGWGA